MMPGCNSPLKGGKGDLEEFQKDFTTKKTAPFRAVFSL